MFAHHFPSLSLFDDMFGLEGANNVLASLFVIDLPM